MKDCQCEPIIPSPEELFNLNGWGHAPIFDGVEYIWNALKKLRAYLEGLSHKNYPLKEMFGGAVNILGREDAVNFDGATFLPDVVLDTTSGPIFLGKGARLGPYAYIRGPALISEGCVVGHCSEVKNSIMMPGSHASHRVYVGDSILGNRINLANNTSLNNWRFNEQDVVVTTNCKCSPDCLCADLHIETLMRKFGAILGDDVKTGSNVAINPGTIVHKGSWLYSAREWGPGILTQGMVRMDRKHI